MSLKLNNRNDLDVLRRKINEALESVTEETRVQFKAGSISYAADGGNATLKLEMLSVSEDGTVVIPERKALESYASLYPWLDMSRIDEPFLNGGKRFVLTGYKPRSPRFPFLARDVNWPRERPTSSPRKPSRRTICR